MSVLLNILLFVIKFIAGKSSGSISITADAFNNLTDAVTVLFSILGVWISSIGPGENHPDGHGKFEWVFALITSFSVLLVGWELLRDSIASILHPSEMKFSWITLLILFISIGIKIFLYFYNIAKSKKRNLLSLRAVAIDSLSDAASTMTVLVSLILNTFFDLKLDGFFGVVVSFLIMYNAIMTVSESIRSIVGVAAPENRRREITEIIEVFFKIPVDIIDLKISDYGYNRHTVSFHIVSNDRIQADDLLCIVPLIQKRIYEQFHYESMIQVEKAVKQRTSNMVIEKAKKNMINAGYPYGLSDARVLTCKDGSYQLAASIIVPYLEKSVFDKLWKFVSKPESFGLKKEDSVLIKVLLEGYKDEK